MNTNIEWEQQKPTEEGAYWLKGQCLNNPEAVSLVRVDWYDGELCIVDAENADEHRADLAAWRNDFFWAGPLTSCAALTEQAETHAIELRKYEAIVANLGHQLETERMRLAACGVIALANTPESAARAREMLPEYWSASAKDCADMVDREMALRERIRQLEAERATPEMCKAGSDAAYWDMTFDTEDAAIVYQAMRAAAPAQEKDNRPANCRNRLSDEGNAYPRSGCAHCKTGGITGCPFKKEGE